MLQRQIRIGDVPISHSRAINCVRFLSPSMLATCGADDRVRVWEWPDQRKLYEAPGSLLASDSRDDYLYVASREPQSVKTRSFEMRFQMANISKIDLRTGQTVAATEPARIEICALAASPFGPVAAAARLTHPAVLFDAQTLEPLFELKHSGEETFGCIHFLDETHVLTRGYTINDYDTVIYIWDLTSRESSVAISGARTEFSVSPDGRFVAAGACERGRVCVWNLKDGSLYREFVYAEEDWPMETAFFHRAPLLAVVGQGKDRTQPARLQVWHLESGELLADITPSGSPHWLNSVCISPDDRWVVVGASDGRIRAWDWQSRTERQSSTAHSGHIRSIVYLNDESFLTSGDKDNSVRKWKAHDGSAAGVELSLNESAGDLAFSSLSGTLASSHDSGIRLWRSRRGSFSGQDSFIGLLPHSGVKQSKFLRDGKRLASAGSDGTIRLWDVETQRELVRLQIHDEASDQYVGRFALTPDEAGVAFTQLWSSRVTIWDWESRAESARLKATRCNLFSLAFAPDGEFLAAAGADDGKVTIWKWPQGEVVQRLNVASGHVNAVLFCPTNPDILASADAAGNVQLFDWKKKKRICCENIDSGQAWSLAFTPDGRRLIAGSEFGVIAIWELA